MRSLFIVLLQLPSLLILAACASNSGMINPSSVMTDTAEKSVAHQPSALPMPLRLAFMSGHVNAGITLYHAGEPEMASSHLLHPVSETHADERTELEEIGFSAPIFESVALALEARKPNTLVLPLLERAREHMEMLKTKVGGDPTTIIRFLLETTIEEYSIGVQNGELTDLGEYQDAFGFALTAAEHASRLPKASQNQLVEEVSSLQKIWLRGPLPVENPAPAEELSMAVSAILSQM